MDIASVLSEPLFRSVLIAAFVSVVGWKALRVCERKVLMPWLARSRRGAWATDARYWAHVRESEAEEVPELIPRERPTGGVGRGRKEREARRQHKKRCSKMNSWRAWQDRIMLVPNTA
jgi:hypothetical protein